MRPNPCGSVADCTWREVGQPPLGWGFRISRCGSLRIEGELRGDPRPYRDRAQLVAHLVWSARPYGAAVPVLSSLRSRPWLRTIVAWASTTGTPHRLARCSTTAKRSLGTAGAFPYRANGPSVSSSTCSGGSRCSNGTAFLDLVMAGLTENQSPATRASSTAAGGPVYQCRIAGICAWASRVIVSRSAPRL